MNDVTTSELGENEFFCRKLEVCTDKNACQSDSLLGDLTNVCIAIYLLIHTFKHNTLLKIFSHITERLQTSDEEKFLSYTY